MTIVVYSKNGETLVTTKENEKRMIRTWFTGETCCRDIRLYGRYECESNQVVAISSSTTVNIITTI